MSSTVVLNICACTLPGACCLPRHVVVQVAPLHQRSFQASTLPSSPTLCGSFDQQLQSRPTSSGTDRAAPECSNWFATNDPEEACSKPPAGENCLMPDMQITTDLARGRLASLNKPELQAQPDVRYRVRLEEALPVGRKAGGWRLHNHEDHNAYTRFSERVI